MFVVAPPAQAQDQIPGNANEEFTTALSQNPVAESDIWLRLLVRIKTL